MNPIEGEPWLKCPTCGYDLRGLPENRCPECGREFDPAELRTCFEQKTREKLSDLGFEYFGKAIIFFIAYPFEALVLIGLVELLDSALPGRGLLRLIPLWLVAGYLFPCFLLLIGFLQRLDRSGIPRLNTFTILLALFWASPGVVFLAAKMF